MRARLFHRRGAALLVSIASALLVTLAVLTPTGAAAVPNSLKVTSADAVVTSSCEFTVTRHNPNNTGDPTNTARLTMRASEIKPSFFAPRKVATLFVHCTVLPNGLFPPSQSFHKFNNGSTVYKTQYINVLAASNYSLCVFAEYILRDGTYGVTEYTCNPPLPE
jgi:hypothetical protein